MRILKAALAAATLALAAPVWAHGGHDRHGHRHHAKHHHHHHHSEWRYYGRPHHRHYVRRDYVYYAPAYPVYASPPPGVHIVMPNVYIPLR